jgi:ABC-type bacteriocin/lantibiotic exporter with double-glycine peptidase domain
MQDGVRAKRSELQAAMRVFRLLHGETQDITVIFVYALAAGLCTLAIPVGVQAVVNSVAFGVVLQPLVVITALVGGVLLFSGILRVLQLMIVDLLQRRLVVRLSLSFAGRIPHVQSEQFKGKFGPEYVLRFLEVFSAQKNISAFLLDGVALFFQVVVGLVLVSFYHPFFLAFALLLALLLVVMVLTLGVGAINSSIRESDAKYEVVTWLQDVARVPVLFKSERGDSFALERADQLVSNYVSWRAKHFRVLLRQVIGAMSLQVIASTMLLGLGGWLVIKQQLTLGQLVAAELVLGTVLTGVTKLGGYLEKFYELCASVAKLDALFDVPYEKLSGSFFSPGSEPARLQISNLTVGRSLTDAPLLSGVSLTIEPGEKVAIQGQNGSGKSTLANVIYRLENPKSGRIEIDGHDVREVHPLELRSEIALVRDLDFFHGSIEQNIALSKAPVPTARVREALRMAGVLEDVYALPNGLQTILKGQAEPLSRGQAVRLVIARAILMEPRLIIIDGMLDGIDDSTVGQLLSELTGPRAPWSLLVLTHESHILRHFATQYILEGGRLIQANKTEYAV